MHGVPVLGELLDRPFSQSPHRPPAGAFALADDCQRDGEPETPVFLSGQRVGQHVCGAASEPELDHRRAGAGTLVRIERVELPRQAAEPAPEPPPSR